MYNTMIPGWKKVGTKAGEESFLGMANKCSLLLAHPSLPPEAGQRDGGPEIIDLDTDEDRSVRHPGDRSKETGIRPRLLAETTNAEVSGAYLSVSRPQRVLHRRKGASGHSAGHR